MPAPIQSVHCALWSVAYTRNHGADFPPLKFKYAPWYFLIDSFETDNEAIPKYARGQVAGAAPAHRSPRRQRSHGSGAPLSHLTPPFPPNTGHTQRGWLANMLSDVASTFPSFPLQHYSRTYFFLCAPSNVKWLFHASHLDFHPPVQALTHPSYIRYILLSVCCHRPPGETSPPQPTPTAPPRSPLLLFLP